MKYTKICECCGNKVAAYTHKLNDWLMKAFNRLCKKRDTTRKPVNIWKDIELTKVQYCNFQKLQHWWVVQHWPWWREPTSVWLRFRQWLDPVYDLVATMWNKRLPHSHEARLTHSKMPSLKYIRDFKDFEYKKREEYAHEKTPSLFVMS